MQTFFSDILHVISQALLIPDIILLLLLIAYGLFSIGSVLVEYFTEHKHYEVMMPKLLAALTESDEGLIPSIIEESGLLKRQKEALNTVFEYRNLPGDALIALVKRLMSEEEAHYDRITDWNNMAAKVAPMLGLMGTLIPLGPGIQALGQADTAALSSSLLVAFDTTVAGLVTAAVCLVIGKVRTSWYDNYMSALDSAMATMLQKFEDSHAAPLQGDVLVEQQTEQPLGYEPYQPQPGYDVIYGEQMTQQPIAPDMTAGAPLDVASGADITGSINAVDPTLMGGVMDQTVSATTPSGMPIDSVGATTPSGMPIESVTGGQSPAGLVFEPVKNPVSDEDYPNQ